MYWSCIANERHITAKWNFIGKLCQNLYSSTIYRNQKLPACKNHTFYDVQWHQKLYILQIRTNIPFFHEIFRVILGVTSVYTRVSEFIPWIMSKLWAEFMDKTEFHTIIKKFIIIHLGKNKTILRLNIIEI